MYRRLFCCASLLFAVGCGQAYLHSYQSFGTPNYAQDQAIKDLFKTMHSEKSPCTDVRFLEDTYPEGIAVEGDTISTIPGANIQTVGKFKIQWTGPSGMEPEKALLDLCRMATAAKANVVTFHKSGEGFYQVEGILFEQQAIAVENQEPPTQGI